VTVDDSIAAFSVTVAVSIFACTEVTVGVSGVVAVGVCVVLLGDGDCSGLDMGVGATEAEGEGSGVGD
jgi:NhaP-type Na+/H+ and K+/H+ antiporter